MSPFEVEFNATNLGFGSIIKPISSLRSNKSSICEVEVVSRGRISMGSLIDDNE